MFLLYPYMTALGLVFTLVAWILNPIVVLFADKDRNLPKWLSWFQTFDAPLPNGYWEAVKWLDRNPAYGFDLNVLGITFKPEDWTCLKLVKNEVRTIFFAVNKVGAFNFVYYDGPRDRWFKLGWKAWNFFDPGTKTFSRNWVGTNGKAPIC